MVNPQHTQASMNLDGQIQDFLGWLMNLDKKKFTAFLEQSGHHAPAYHAEKWTEFQKNPVAFAWNWTPELVIAWRGQQ